MPFSCEEAVLLRAVRGNQEPARGHRCGWPQRHVGAFQLKVSVDQDLTVVAEALDDDAVKRWLVSIVFTRA